MSNIFFPANHPFNTDPFFKQSMDSHVFSGRPPVIARAAQPSGAASIHSMDAAHDTYTPAKSHVSVGNYIKNALGLAVVVPVWTLRNLLALPLCAVGSLVGAIVGLPVAALVALTHLATPSDILPAMGRTLKTTIRVGQGVAILPLAPLVMIEVLVSLALCKSWYNDN